MVTTVDSRFRFSHGVGVMAHGGRGFSTPVDITIGNDDLLYVISRSNPTQGPMGGTRVTMCRVDESYLGTFGAFGEDDGQFIWPTSIVADSQGRIYVSDEHRHDIQVFSPEG